MKHNFPELQSTLESYPLYRILQLLELITKSFSNNNAKIKNNLFIWLRNFLRSLSQPLGALPGPGLFCAVAGGWVLLVVFVGASGGLLGARDFSPTFCPFLRMRVAFAFCLSTECESQYLTESSLEFTRFLWAFFFLFLDRGHCGDRRYDEGMSWSNVILDSSTFIYTSIGCPRYRLT